MSQRASDEVLSGLHLALTEALLSRIESGTATASDLAVAAKLLKDNNITCIPTTDNAMGALEEKMQRQREKRQAQRAGGKATVSELDEVRRRAMGGS